MRSKNTARLEKPDDESPHSADIMRLDFKLNLLLDLAGQLLAASQPRAAARTDPLQRHGRDLAVGRNRWRQARTASSRSRCSDLIVQPLHLPAEIVSSAARGRDARALPGDSAKRSPITSRSWCFAATGEKLPARASSRA